MTPNEAFNEYALRRQRARDSVHRFIEESLERQRARHDLYTLNELCGPMGRILPPDPPRRWKFFKYDR